MATLQKRGSLAKNDSNGSRTMTITARETQPERVVITARLPEVEESQPRRRVMFTEDTVDNEGLGRKSTKVCCIYHKPKLFGESSSESDSSDDEISPLERKPKQMKQKKKKKCADEECNRKCDS
ncbi:Oidioi.mRNA.OKI2018_I69.XSR.g14344.t1.cds [Oikopleura dioica]|uniref:E3 ubiquitin-protein ligase PPP1R11 n=1 Tax=Oikopleura dioica TaxID=34765 RepID=A0ABN7SDF6_OIKDI|nr:Oidioi.mRNA.OKI2018_I69.XSR.g14344.t1.cds [Oikopleura dioica]